MASVNQCAVTFPFENEIPPAIPGGREAADRESSLAPAGPCRALMDMDSRSDLRSAGNDKPHAPSLAIGGWKARPMSQGK